MNKLLNIHLKEFPEKKDLLPFSEYLRLGLKNFQPGYFAMVMATGIVSLATNLYGLDAASQSLLVLNTILYVGLWLILLIRMTCYFQSFFDDYKSHQKGPGYFTIVAANSILGTQFFFLTPYAFIARYFWWSSLILCVVITYSVFVLLIIKQDKPDLSMGMNGGWLVAIVAIQSLTVLGALIGKELFHNDQIAFFIFTSFWLFGGMLYIWIISIIFYRYMFLEFSPVDLMPPYWINMGAVAISTLAGSFLISGISEAHPLADIIPFIKGFTLMFWSTATWWIPMLLILGIWRHLYRKVAFEYDPHYWGMIFPLGMYAVCTYRLYEVFDAPDELVLLSKVFTVFAFVSWFILFLGVLKQLLYLIILGTRAKATTYPRSSYGKNE